jgi:hypothetical protein
MNDRQEHGQYRAVLVHLTSGSLKAYAFSQTGLRKSGPFGTV